MVHAWDHREAPSRSYTPQGPLKRGCVVSTPRRVQLFVSLMGSRTMAAYKAEHTPRQAAGAVGQSLAALMTALD